MTTILTLYQDLGLTARKKTAGEHAGPCPACGGDDRFLIFDGQGKDGLGRYLCRQCERAGDAIQFLRDFRGLSYGQACRELGRTPEPGDSRGPAAPRTMNAPGAAPALGRRFEPRENPAPGASWQEKAGKLVAWAEKNLAERPEVLAWLERERGISLATARRMRLGWIPENLFRDRAAWGLSPEQKEDGRPKKIFIPEGLVIPVIGADGLIRRVKIRRPKPGPHEPRYLPVPSEPKNTAPLVIRTGARAWAIVESELDAVLLAQEAGELVNVAALGSASYRPDVELFPLLMAAPFVLVCLDFDDAGNKAAWSWWSEHLPEGQCRVWPVPEGKDPSEAWSLGWDLAAWIAGGLPPALQPEALARPRAAPDREEAAEEEAEASGDDEPDPAPEAAPQAVDPRAALHALRAFLEPRGWAIVRYPDGLPALYCGEGTADDLDAFRAFALLKAAGPAIDAGRLPLYDEPVITGPEPAPEPEAEARARSGGWRIGRGQVAQYRKGRAWALARLPELERAGWTRAGLFRAGRLCYPYGPWGLCWYGEWTRPDLAAVELDPAGRVCFILHDAHGETRMAAQPQ